MSYAQTHLELYAELSARGADDEALGRVRAAYDLAVRLFASRFRPCGRPFVTHLVGTASALFEHGGDVDSVGAALLHAAYAQGEFGDREQGASPGHRSTLRRVVGDEVEELVHAYHETPWPPSSPGDAARELLDLGRETTGWRVALLRVANEIDDARDLGPLYGGAAKRATIEQGLEAALALAELLGGHALRDEILRLQTELAEGKVSPVLVSNHDRSQIVDPVRLRERVRRALGHVGSSGRRS